MQTISREQYVTLITGVVSRRLIRELRFNPESIDDWQHRELLVVSTRSGNEGVLLIELSQQLYVLPYERSRPTTNAATGRARPVTCDLCYTWQAGGKAANITFTSRADKNTHTFLCCADLQCSLHVRSMTAESHLSRAQLHEDIDTARRVERLRQKLEQLLAQLQEQPRI